MSEITLHTGSMGSEWVISVEWMNEDCVPMHDQIVLRVPNVDKPRRVELIVNGVKIGELPGTFGKERGR